MKQNTKKELEEFSKSLKHGLFAERPTMKEAMDFAYEIIETLDVKDRSAAFTALHVVMNTISNDIIKVVRQ